MSETSLPGITLNYNMWNDVIAFRWARGKPGMIEVVRANRRDFRERRGQWVVTGPKVEDAKKLSLKNGFKQASVAAFLADEKVPDGAGLIAELRRRFLLDG